MDTITEVKIINVVTIILISTSASLFFAFSPAKRRSNMAVAIKYFSLFFLCVAASYLLLAARQIMDKTLSILITNTLEVIGIQGLYHGFLWRKGIKKHLHKNPFVIAHIFSFLFIQVVLFTILYDAMHIRNLLTAINYGVLMLACIKYVKIHKDKVIYGERIMRNGLIIAPLILTTFAITQYFSSSELELLALAMLSQVMIVMVLYGSLTSLTLSDVIEVFKMSSITDSMTGLFNRRHFNDRATTYLKDASRSGNEVALIICDIDLFKSINDSYGHDIGDKVICTFSDLLKGMIRENDIAARYGGEEFIILLPSTDETGALALAEKIRDRIQNESIPVPHFDNIKFTASFGVSLLENNSDLEVMIKAADEAMYRAKNNGRNRVEI